MAVEPVTIGESTAGPSFLASDQEAVLAILGTSSSGDVDVPVVARSDTQPGQLRGEGPLVEAGRIVVGEGRQPVVLVRVTTATPGGYGVVDDSDFTGTADVGVDVTTEPYNAYQGHIEFVDGGTVGTTGITYRDSLDNGQQQFAKKPLGTATSITISQGNVEFTINPPAAGLVALANDVRQQYIDHISNTGGVWHTNPDATNTVTTAAATDIPSAITLLNEIRGDYEAHRVLTAGTVHDAPDNANDVTAPAATDGPSAVTLANDLKVQFNLHRAQAGVHALDDTTNIVTAANASQGTVNAGDIIRVNTTAPLWDSGGLTTALAALPGYTGHPFGGILIMQPIPDLGSYTAIVNALDALEARQRPCSAILEERLPNDGETETQYRLALEATWMNRADNRLILCAGEGQYDPTTLRQTQYFLRRMHTAPYAARCVALRYEQSPGIVEPIARAPGPTPSTFGGKLRGFRIFDDRGEQVGHDEIQDPGLSDLRFVTTTTYPQEGDDAFIHKPYTLRPEGDTVYLHPIRRMANVWKRIVYKYLTQKVATYLLHLPGQATITEEAANDLAKFTLGKLRPEFSGRASGIGFVIDLTTDVSVPDPRILWNGSLVTGFYIDGFDGVVAINQDT